ncbi:MAG: hypothetical protein ABI781_09285 [Burkholderiales bacterium]
MISRLTTFASAFAVLATASLAYAAGAQYPAPVAPAATVKQVRVVQLERVVIVAKRLPQQAI